MAPLRAKIAIAISAALIPIAASPCPGKHHIDRAAIAAGTDKPHAPIDNARRVTVSSSEVRGIGFDLVAAQGAPQIEFERTKLLAGHRGFEPPRIRHKILLDEVRDPVTERVDLNCEADLQALDGT